MLCESVAFLSTAPLCDGKRQAGRPSWLHNELRCTVAAVSSIAEWRTQAWHTVSLDGRRVLPICHSFACQIRTLPIVELSRTPQQLSLCGTSQTRTRTRTRSHDCFTKCLEIRHKPSNPFLILRMLHQPPTQLSFRLKTLFPSLWDWFPQRTPIENIPIWLIQQPIQLIQLFIL